MINRDPTSILTASLTILLLFRLDYPRAGHGAQAIAANADRSAFAQYCTITTAISLQTTTISADCHNLPAFPSDIPTNITNLKLICTGPKDSSGMPIPSPDIITTFPKDSISRLTNLVVFSSNGCPIMELPSEMFKNLAKLDIVHIDFARIRRLGGDLFFDAFNLREITLANCVFLDWLDPVIFTRQSNLHSIFLTRTNLQGTVVAEAIAPLQSTLRELKWTQNEAPLIIPSSAFKGFQFDHLDLSFNQLPSTDFLQETQTRWLSLRGNTRLTQVLNFTRYSHLRDLTYLDLSHMDLREELNPNNTRKLYKLHTLLLSNNFIQKLDSATLEALPIIQRIDLSNNQLTTLPDTLDAKFSNTDFTIYLAGNRFHCNCEFTWIVMRHKRLAESILCATGNPASLANKQLVGLNPSILACSVPQTPTIQLKGLGPLAEETSLPNTGRSYVTKIYADQTVTFQCKSTGDPAPTMKWQPPSGKANIRKAKLGRDDFFNSINYFLDQRQLSHANQIFICYAENIQGTTYSRVRVLNMAPPPCCGNTRRPDQPSPITPPNPNTQPFTPNAKEIKTDNGATMSPIPHFILLHLYVVNLILALTRIL